LIVVLVGEKAVADVVARKGWYELDRLENTGWNEGDMEQVREGGGVGDNYSVGDEGGMSGASGEHGRSLDVDIADIDQDKVVGCKGKGGHREEDADEGADEGAGEGAGAGAGADIGSNWRDQDLMKGQPSLYCGQSSRDGCEFPSIVLFGLG